MNVHHEYAFKYKKLLLNYLDDDTLQMAFILVRYSSLLFIEIYAVGEKLLLYLIPTFPRLIQNRFRKGQYVVFSNF